MFWNAFLEGAISMAFVIVYFYLCPPIFIFFLSVRTYFHLCALVWMLKLQKYWFFFFLLKTLWHEYFFNQIMNNNIYHQNNITAKSWILIFVICYAMLCILYLKSMHKIVYNKKLINIDWLMLHSLQETKSDA